MYDFDKIFLSKSDLLILDHVYSGTIAHLNEAEAEHLLSIGLISEYSLSEASNKYVITPFGKLYKEYIDFREDLESKKRMKEQKRFWIPLIINSLFSISSLAISIIALLK